MKTVGLTALASTAVLLAAAWTTPLSAQEVVTPTEAQVALLEQGLEAQRAGQYPEAAGYFRAAIQIQDGNVLRLNLGRALQKQDRCVEAARQYQKALTAPRFEALPHEDVVQRVERFTAEMATTCTGTVTAVCDPALVTVTVAGGSLACGDTVRLKPGMHPVVVRMSGVERVTEIEVVAMRDAPVEVVLHEPFHASDVSIPAGLRRPEASVDATRLAGWAFVVVGGGAILTGAAFSWQTASTNADIDALADQDFGNAPRDPARANALIEEAESGELGQLVCYGSGAILVGVGAVLLMLDEDGDDTARWSLWATEGDAGLVWTVAY